MANTLPAVIRALDYVNLADGECREFVACDEGGGETSGVLIRFRGELHAYLNACPHLGICLNWEPNRFLSSSGNHIQCAMHGALFEIETGFCVSGPCVGQSLEKLTIGGLEEERVHPPG